MINFNYVNYIENWDKNIFLSKSENVYAKRALLLLSKNNGVIFKLVFLFYK